MRGTGLAFVYEHLIFFITRLSVRGLHSTFSSLSSMADIMASRRVPAANPYFLGELSTHSNMALRAAASSFFFLRPLCLSCRLSRSASIMRSSQSRTVEYACCSFLIMGRIPIPFFRSSQTHRMIWGLPGRSDLCALRSRLSPTRGMKSPYLGTASLRGSRRFLSVAFAILRRSRSMGVWGGGSRRS